MQAIGLGFNFTEVGAPAFVKSYNGKPVLFANGGSKPAQREGFVDILPRKAYMEVPGVRSGMRVRRASQGGS